jgi:chromosome segregation ATPase
MSDVPAPVLDSARLLRACRSLARRWRQQRDLHEQTRADLRAVRASCQNLAHERDQLAAAHAETTHILRARAGENTVDAAKRVWSDRNRLASLDYELSAIESALDHCAPIMADGRTLSPAERVRWLDDENRQAAIDRDRLAAEVEQLTAAVNAAARDHAAVEAERARLSRAVETAEADRDTARAQLAALESDRARLYQCASEQGEADCGNGLVLVRRADLTALRSRQTGMDPATVRLLHELLDRLLFVDGRGGVA